MSGSVSGSSTRVQSLVRKAGTLALLITAPPPPPPPPPGNSIRAKLSIIQRQTSFNLSQRMVLTVSLLLAPSVLEDLQAIERAVGHGAGLRSDPDHRALVPSAAPRLLYSTFFLFNSAVENSNKSDKTYNCVTAGWLSRCDDVIVTSTLWRKKLRVGNKRISE